MKKLAYSILIMVAVFGIFGMTSAQDFIPLCDTTYLPSIADVNESGDSDISEQENNFLFSLYFGVFPAAEEAIENIEDIDPNYNNLFLYRGCLAQSISENDVAIQEFESYLETITDPDRIENVEEAIETLSSMVVNLLDVSSPETILDDLVTSQVLDNAGYTVDEMTSYTLTRPGLFAVKGTDHPDVVFGAEINLTSAGGVLESCILGNFLEYRDDGSPPPIGGFAVGLSRSQLGSHVMQLTNFEANDTELVRIDYTPNTFVSLVSVLVDDTLTVYWDGRAIVEDYAIRVSEGSFTTGLLSDSNITCRYRNLFLNAVNIDNDFSCIVTSNSSINKREEPSTQSAIVGQLQSTDTLGAILQTVDSAGFTWWQLIDNSWVRDDVVNAVGECDDVPSTSE